MFGHFGRAARVGALCLPFELGFVLLGGAARWKAAAFADSIVGRVVAHVVPPSERPERCDPTRRPGPFGRPGAFDGPIRFASVCADRGVSLVWRLLPDGAYRSINITRL